MALDLISPKPRKYGRWTVLGKTFYSRWNGMRLRHAVVECRCGNRNIVVLRNLKSGISKSCGCATRESIIARSIKHGCSHLPEYRVWEGMRERCEYENHKSHQHYGERGIKVCERWRSFTNFYADMGPRPSAQHSIERKDVHGDYCPENCIWGTDSQQARNKTNTPYYTFRGETHDLTTWSEILGIGRGTLWSRLNVYGFSIEKSFTLPLHEGNRGSK